jgi:phosphatidate cytidylyltransferase
MIPFALLLILALPVAQADDGAANPAAEPPNRPTATGPTTSPPTTTAPPTTRSPTTDPSTAGAPTTDPPSAANSDNRTNRSKVAWLNLRTNWLLGVVMVALAITWGVGRVLERRHGANVDPAIVRRLNHRVQAWWTMCSILVVAFLLQRIGTVFLFFVVSFWALREFITMTPTRRGDHRALFWVFMIITPIQYLLVGIGDTLPEWLKRIVGDDFQGYALYSIFIPVYASLFIPARIAMSGDSKRFLERSAKIISGLLICVYALSFAPALLDLTLVTSRGKPWTGSPASLLFFLVLIAQLADVLQFAWTRLTGRHPVAADINASRTWEGLLGSAISTAVIGAALYWATPFQPIEAALMSMLVAVLAFAGGLTMSAIKRDRGVNDTGSLVSGHPGLLDRIDNVCFAAPVFYHVTRLFFTP